MSLATLKKKTAAKYKNASVNTPSTFSLNGIHRNQGYVGQSSVGRSLSRAMTTNDGTLRGGGSCCGVYKSGPALQSGITQNDVSKTVKTSVLSQHEVLNRRKGCVNGSGGEINAEGLTLFSGSVCNVVKNDGPKYNNTQGDYVEYYRQKKTQEVIDCVTASQKPKTVYKNCNNNIFAKPTCPYVKETVELKSAMSQGDYIFKLKSSCPDQTKQGLYFSHSGGTGVVCP